MCSQRSSTTTAFRRISSTGHSLYRLSSLRPLAVPRVHVCAFSSTVPTPKRRFNPLPELAAMDVSALTTRLTNLGLSTSAAPSSDAAAVLTYFFTPKSGSKHPDNAEQDLKLVVVAIEDAKNLGPAKALATSVGLKDMRAVSGADLEKLIGRTRDQGERRAWSYPHARDSSSLTHVGERRKTNHFSVSPLAPCRTRSFDPRHHFQLAPFRLNLERALACEPRRVARALGRRLRQGRRSAQV